MFVAHERCEVSVKSEFYLLTFQPYSSEASRVFEIGPAPGTGIAEVHYSVPWLQGSNSWRTCWLQEQVLRRYTIVYLGVQRVNGFLSSPGEEKNFGVFLG